MLGIRPGPRRRRSSLLRARHAAAHEPAVAAALRLPPVQAAVDENPREPDLERPRFAIRRDTGKYLDERVLDRFVGLSHIAQILIRNSRRAPLVERHELAEPLARLVHLAALDEPADIERNPRVLSDWRRDARTPSGRCLVGSAVRRGRLWSWSPIAIHRSITIRVGRCLQCTPPVRRIDAARAREYDSPILRMLLRSRRLEWVAERAGTTAEDAEHTVAQRPLRVNSAASF